MLVEEKVRTWEGEIEGCLESGERRGGVKKGVKEEFHIKKQKKIECGKMRKGCTQYNGPNFFSQSSHYLSFIFTDVLF